jgi:phospholipid/cholesterol/gamma-HCH transport system ATP-binding protein
VALLLRKYFGLRDAEARQKAREYLDKVQMGPFAEHLPATLSDGMRKRVAIARALTLRPEYMLFDEPTTGLDPISARRVDALIRELREREHVTAIVVSHDLTSIFTVADRVALLYQGRVQALGTPEELRKSGDPIVQQFITGAAEGPMETPGF